jgi:hypothetical protein
MNAAAKMRKDRCMARVYTPAGRGAGHGKERLSIRGQ